MEGKVHILYQSQLSRLESSIMYTISLMALDRLEISFLDKDIPFLLAVFVLLLGLLLCHKCAT